MRAQRHLHGGSVLRRRVLWRQRMVRHVERDADLPLRKWSRLYGRRLMCLRRGSAMRQQLLPADLPALIT